MALADSTIFTMVYFGKLTRIVEDFESHSSQENALSMMASQDERGNTPFDIAWYLGYKNIILYFLKWGANPCLLDHKKRWSFHFLLAKREYDTLMIVINFLKHQTKEELFRSVKNLKQSFGFKNSDIKHGELTSTGFQSKETLDRFNGFMKSMINLWAYTFSEFLKIYRQLLTQQDYNGRTPIHYAKFEKSIKAVLDIGLETEEGFEDFKFECSQLASLEDPNISKPLEPRKYFFALKEFKHFLSPEDYDKIYREYLSEKKLLIHDILNTRDLFNETPLHIASRQGNYVLVSHYLKHGAKVTKNINSHFPLDIAKDRFTRRALTNLNVEAFNWADQNINELMEKGENVNQRLSIFGQPPLHKAVDSTNKDNVKTIKTLLDYEADVNLIDYNGWTALHHAAFKGDFEASVELIKNGANVNAYSTMMKTPLHLAAFYNHPEIINLLVESGANLQGLSNDEFLQYSTNKHSICFENVAPLLLAAKRGNIECFELLLKLKAYFYTTDIRNWNCLHYATYHGHLEMIRLILRLDYEQNVLRNMENTQGMIPKYLCGSLKAQLLYEEEWVPEYMGEGDYEEGGEEPEMNQPPQDLEQPAEGTVQ
jgi:ankyrin repeat protein